MHRRTLLTAAAAVPMAASAPKPALGQGHRAVCCNCPPEWADWASALRAVREHLGITMPHDNNNSGQTLARLIAEKARPVADIACFGGNFGPRARPIEIGRMVAAQDAAEARYRAEIGA